MSKFMWAGVGMLPLAALAMMGGTALAADLSVQSPPLAPMAGSAPIISWTGFYAGVHGGGGWGSQNPNTPATFSLSGPYVGAQVGYNWQANQLVFGLEADASWSGIDGIRVTGGPGGTTTEDINWFSTVRGRLGWAMGDGSWLPYVTGGWAFANATRTNSSFGGQTFTASHSGWTVGAGIEKQFASHWSLKAEYKYVDLGSARYNWPILPTTASLKVQTLEVGLNYRF